MTEHANLPLALIAAQKDIGKIVKDKQAGGGSRTYLYADLPTVLDAIEPALHNNGLVVLQPLTNLNGHPAVQTILIHAKTGEQIEGVVPVSCADMTDPQKVGGAITYNRRYALLAILCQATEQDDDAQHARTPSATGTIKPAARPNSPTASLPRYPESEEPYTNDPQSWTTAPQRTAPPRNEGGYRGDTGGDPELTGTMSPKQWGFIKVKQRQAGMTDDEMDALAMDHFGKIVAALDRKEASDLIDQITG